jgi:hypothetical protein
MSEALCAAPAFHLPGGYRVNNGRRSAKEQRDVADGGAHLVYYYSNSKNSAVVYPACWMIEPSVPRFKSGHAREA